MSDYLKNIEISRQVNKDLIKEARKYISIDYTYDSESNSEVFRMWNTFAMNNCILGVMSLEKYISITKHLKYKITLLITSRKNPTNYISKMLREQIQLFEKHKKRIKNRKNKLRKQKSKKR